MTTTKTVDASPPFEEPATHALAQFKEITRQHALFHISFFILACAELLAFILFFAFLTQSTLIAFSLAALFLTAFAYFILLFYFQAKKPEQLLAVRHLFLKNYHTRLSFHPGVKEYHIALSQALQRMLAELHRQEYTYYSLPASFKTLSPLFQKFSVWCHWKDVHRMKEILLLMRIKEQVELVKIAPTDLEVHAGLAHGYLALSQLYLDPRKVDPDLETPWVSPDYFSRDMGEKFKKASWRAIEEFKILDAYAPNDPWVHTQLAAVYHNLEMPEEEIREYETILKIAPQEKEILFRLGVLYFSQGRNAQALRLFEQLKKIKDSRAEELLSFYDAQFLT